MNIKKILLAIGISTISIQSFAGSCPATPSETAKKFYFDYLTSYMEGKNPIKDKHVQEYSSTRLIVTVNKLKYSGEDYVLKAQDYFDEWVSNINVKEIKTEDNSSHVLVTLGNSEDNYQKLNVELVKNEKCWKVDSVKD